VTEEPGPADRSFLQQAIALSRRCPPSDTAFSVGAILVGGSGEVITTGYSREREKTDHAEQVALAKAARLAAPGPALVPAGATLYTSLEPCLRRVSQPLSCARLIVDAGIGRVVLAWREPPLFMPGGGADWLREQGVTVVELPELAEAARAVNAHLLAR
jgi:diaminohydroxyphosphoribosylaminopyrimidine deaminase / 5-amino-6-(5-phosphoribosylamino)uracil reductase